MTSTCITPIRTAAPTTAPLPAPTEVSRHATSEGTVVWSRCTCGRLRMLLFRDLTQQRTQQPVLVAGGRTPHCPNCHRAGRPLTRGA